jgi:hypothetical protein
LSSLSDELAPYVAIVRTVKPPSLIVGEDGFPFEDLDLLVGPRKYLSKLTPEFVRAVVSEVGLGSVYPRLAVDLTEASVPAQNSLLKFLEEAPIVITLYAQSSLEPAVLPTVQSRCMRQALPPAPLGLLKAVLRLRGVSDGTLARIPASYARSIADALVEFDLDTAGRVSEVLRGMAGGDAARAFTASRGFDVQCCRHLSLLIRGHLAGNGHQAAFARAPHDILAAWAEQLESDKVPPGLAVRWGILEVLSA